MTGWAANEDEPRLHLGPWSHEPPHNSSVLGVRGRKLQPQCVAGSTEDGVRLSFLTYETDMNVEVSGDGILGIVGCLALVPFLHVFYARAALFYFKNVGRASRRAPLQFSATDTTARQLGEVEKEGVAKGQSRSTVKHEPRRAVNLTDITPEDIVDEKWQEHATPAQKTVIEEPFLREHESCALLLGYAMGVRSIWEFPYAVAVGGGWAYILVYAMSMAFVSAPLLLMELALGQYTRVCSFQSAQMIHPIWSGLALCQKVVASCWCVRSLMPASLAWVYAWGCAEFPPRWAKNSLTYLEDELLNSYAPDDLPNQGLGEIQLGIAAAMGVTCILLFLVTTRSIKFQATIARDLVVAVWLLLLAILCSLSQLSGSWKGIIFYLSTFDGKLLGDASVWSSAVTMTFLSLAPGMGAAVTLASVAHPKSDMVRVTVVTACGCLLFSVFGGLVFFMVMGHYAQILGCSVAEVLDLTNVWHVTEEESFFVVFGYLPAAFLDMDSSNLVSALLFALMICLSFSTMLFLLHHLTHCAHVWFNARATVAKWAVSALMCIMFFFVGLQFCTRQGRYLHSIATENCATLLCGLACGEVVMIMVSFQFKRMVISIRMSTFGNRFTPNGRIVPYQSTFQFLMLIVIPLTSLGFFGYLCVESFKRERSSAGLEWYQMLTFLGMASGVIIGLWGAWRGQSALGSLAQEELLLRAALGEVTLVRDEPKEVFHVLQAESTNKPPDPPKNTSLKHWVGRGSAARGSGNRATELYDRSSRRSSTLEDPEEEYQDMEGDAGSSSESTPRSIDAQMLFGI